MYPTAKAPSPRASKYAAVGLAVVAAGVVFAVIAVSGTFSGPWISLSAAAAVTAGVGICGVVLVALARLLAAARFSCGQWVRRSSASALLLTPAAVVLTHQFMAAGWDFDSCGTLLDPNRPNGSNLAGFRLACDAAAGDRFVNAAALAAAGCVVMVGYGLWLRRRADGAHDGRAELDRVTAELNDRPR
ncbi:hypothetical protein ACWKSP_38145 [Micromonosporaceae bacterium Da 78-11]